MRGEKGDPPTPFQRFTDFARRPMAVPKAELMSRLASTGAHHALRSALAAPREPW